MKLYYLNTQSQLIQDLNHFVLRSAIYNAIIIYLFFEYYSKTKTNPQDIQFILYNSL